MSVKYQDFNISQTLRDVIDDNYMQLRKPKKVAFFINGNIYSLCKIIKITPNRYFILQELLRDLTRYFLRYLPNGVRRLFDSIGNEITDLNQLENNHFYICSSNEPFKVSNYEERFEQYSSRDHVHNHNLHYKFFYTLPQLTPDGHFLPETPIYYRGKKLHNATKPPYNDSSLKISTRLSFPLESEDGSSPNSSKKNEIHKPKILTIIRAGEKPYNYFKILLNKANDQKLKDLLSDMSEAFGSKRDSNPINKLIGRNAIAAKNMPDLFNNGDIFIGQGDQDPDLNQEDIEKIIAEVFGNHNVEDKNSLRDDFEREISLSLTAVEEELEPSQLKAGPHYLKDNKGNNKPKNNINYHGDKYPNIKNKNNEAYEKTQKKKPRKTKPIMVEEFPIGYPYNDSRKPGAFDMIPETATEEIIPQKHRAHIFGYERERASQEERARARELMAKKMEKQREEFKANEDTNHHRGWYNHKKPNNSNRLYPNKEGPNENYKLSPYNENLSMPRYNRSNDKENARPYFQNGTYSKHNVNLRPSENDSIGRSYPYINKNRHPLKKLDGHEFDSDPRYRRYPKDSINPSVNSDPKKYYNNFNPLTNKEYPKEEFRDGSQPNNRKQRGIHNNGVPMKPKTTQPRIIFTNDFDNNNPEYAPDNVSSQEPNRKPNLRLPAEDTEKEKGSKLTRTYNGNGNNTDEYEIDGGKKKPKREKETNPKKLTYQATPGEQNQRPYLKPINNPNDDESQRWERIPPINLSSNPRNISDQNKYRAPSSINIPTLGTVTEEDGDHKKIQDKYNDNPETSGLESPKKRRHTQSLSSLIGPRGDTVKISDLGKPLQLPTRTHKQSMMVRNPESQRIVPELATQLSANEDFYELFDVGRLIATGNFSEVKEAKKKKGGKPYAVKIIEKLKLKDKEDLIEEEIRILRSCNHSNIIKLEEQYESPLNVFLVSELETDGDLFDAICDHIKFTESQAAVMIRDLCRALFYLHSRGIAHRDIKPENLLVVKTNGILHLKLADFGLAVEAHDPLFVICGTPTYVAPEILTEKGYGMKVDVWAAGVVAYILLCGFPPFRSPDRKQTELFEFIKAGEFEYLSPYWDNISADAKDFIDQMIVVDPTKRCAIIDALCHRWILTLGNSIRFTAPIEEIQSQMRIDLQIESFSLKSDYEKIK